MHKKSLPNVEVGHSTETEAEETLISASMVLYLWGNLTYGNDEKDQ